MTTSSFAPTPLERAYGTHLLVTYFNTPVDLTDDHGEIRLSGRDAVPFLITSGVDRNLLRLIWSVSDPDGIGTLTERNQFYTILRLIAMAQAHFLPPIHFTSPGLENQQITQLKETLINNSHLTMALPAFEADRTHPTVTYLLGIYPTLTHNAQENKSSAFDIESPESDISIMLTNHDLQFQLWQQQQMRNSGETVSNIACWRSPAPIATMSISDAFGDLPDVEDRPIPSLLSTLPDNMLMVGEHPNGEVSQPTENEVHDEDFGDFDEVSAGAATDNHETRTIDSVGDATEPCQDHRSTGLCTSAITTIFTSDIPLEERYAEENPVVEMDDKVGAQSLGHLELMNTHANTSKPMGAEQDVSVTSVNENDDDEFGRFEGTFHQSGDADEINTTCSIGANNHLDPLELSVEQSTFGDNYVVPPAQEKDRTLPSRQYRTEEGMLMMDENNCSHEKNEPKVNTTVLKYDVDPHLPLELEEEYSHNEFSFTGMDEPKIRKNGATLSITEAFDSLVAAHEELSAPIFPRQLAIENSSDVPIHPTTFDTCGFSNDETPNEVSLVSFQNAKCFDSISDEKKDNDDSKDRINTDRNSLCEAGKEYSGLSAFDDVFGNVQDVPLPPLNIFSPTFQEPIEFEDSFGDFEGISEPSVREPEDAILESSSIEYVAFTKDFIPSNSEVMCSSQLSIDNQKSSLIISDGEAVERLHEAQFPQNDSLFLKSEDAANTAVTREVSTENARNECEIETSGWNDAFASNDVTMIRDYANDSISSNPKVICSGQVSIDNEKSSLFISDGEAVGSLHEAPFLLKESLFLKAEDTANTTVARGGSTQNARNECEIETFGWNDAFASHDVTTMEPHSMRYDETPAYSELQSSYSHFLSAAVEASTASIDEGNDELRVFQDRITSEHETNESHDNEARVIVFVEPSSLNDTVQPPPGTRLQHTSMVSFEGNQRVAQMEDYELGDFPKFDELKFSQPNDEKYQECSPSNAHNDIGNLSSADRSSLPFGVTAHLQVETEYDETVIKDINPFTVNDDDAGSFTAFNEAIRSSHEYSCEQKDTTELVISNAAQYNGFSEDLFASFHESSPAVSSSRQSDIPTTQGGRTQNEQSEFINPLDITIGDKDAADDDFGDFSEFESFADVDIPKNLSDAVEFDATFEDFSEGPSSSSNALHQDLSSSDSLPQKEPMIISKPGTSPREHLDRCSLLREILTEEGTLSDLWDIAITSVRFDVERSLQLLNLFGDLPSGDRTLIKQSKKVDNHIAGLAESVKVARYIAASLKDMLLIDSRINDLLHESLYHLSNRITDEVALIDKVWLEILSISLNFGFSQLPQLESTDEIRNHNKNGVSYHRADLCQLTLQPLMKGENLGTDTPVVWNGKICMARAANLFANKMMSVATKSCGSTENTHASN